MSQRLPQTLCWQAPVLHTERCQLLPCPRRELGAGQPPVPQAPAPHPHPPSPAPAAGACAGAAPAPGAAGPCSPPYPIPYPAHGWVATVGTAQPPNAAPAAHLPGEPWRAAGAAKPAQGRGRLRGRKMVFSQPWLIPAATAAPLPSAAWTGAAGAAQPHGLWGTWRGPGSISCPLTGGLAPPPTTPSTGLLSSMLQPTGAWERSVKHRAGGDGLHGGPPARHRQRGGRAPGRLGDAVPVGGGLSKAAQLPRGEAKVWGKARPQGDGVAMCRGNRAPS